MIGEFKPDADCAYTVKPARYCKGKLLVVCESDGTGFKTRAMRLAEAYGGRWTHREKGYIMSHKAVEGFEQAVKNGWNATPIRGELHDGKGGQVEHRKSVKAKDRV